MTHGANIGCGQTPTKGWRNFDNSISLRLSKIPILPKLLLKVKIINSLQYRYIEFARCNEIQYGDATKGLPLSNGCLDALYSSHMLEHLDHEEVALFFKEARRILRPGGIIRLALPDIRKQVQQYIDSGDADAFIAGTLLTQPRPRTITQRLEILFVGTRHHQWMYDGASLCRLLQSYGFVNATVKQPGTTGIPDPGLLDLQERLSDSVYIEAIRE